MAKMKFCKVCGRYTKEEIADVCTTAYEYIIERIKKDHPEWVEKDGACPKCLEYYKRLGGEKK